MRSLHIAEDDYRKNIKLELLLPSGVPTYTPTIRSTCKTKMVKQEGNDRQQVPPIIVGKVTEAMNVEAQKKASPQVDPTFCLIVVQRANVCCQSLGVRSFGGVRDALSVHGSNCCKTVLRP